MQLKFDSKFSKLPLVLAASASLLPGISQARDKVDLVTSDIPAAEEWKQECSPHPLFSDSQLDEMVELRDNHRDMALRQRNQAALLHNAEVKMLNGPNLDLQTSDAKTIISCTRRLVNEFDVLDK